MRLVMAGLDYTTADIDVRDAFAPDACRQRELLRAMTTKDIPGCVLLATCNRAELYLSYRGDVPPDCVELLCRGLGKDPRHYRQHFVERYERHAVEHLMRVSAGLLSSVPGDDQIITQTRTAAETARDAQTVDPLLEALFRAAVTAGKKVKTHISFARDGSSIANRAVKEITRKLGSLSAKRALVIGNGVIGLLTASNLLEHGCDVAVTLRDPRRKAELPQGCRAVEFDERHLALSGCDVAVSATSSPHYTLCTSDLASIGSLPRLFVDLAVPRDIEPSIGELPDTSLLNVDHLHGDGGEDQTSRQRLAEADAIVRDQAERFDLWRRNRRRYTHSDAGTPDFPVFINLRGSSVLIAGGGKVAARRAEKLLMFGARVHVVSPEISQEMAKLVERDSLTWTREPYHSRHIGGATLVIAATSDREVNAQIGREAKERGILVSVADRREECTFYFPAIIKSDLLAAGLVSTNGDHAMVKKAAARIRDEMEAIDANYQSGQPRERSGGGASRAGNGCDTPKPPRGSP